MTFMNKLILLATLAVLFTPLQAQARKMEWRELVPGTALGVDLDSIQSPANNVVRYETWIIVENLITQTSQFGACDGSGSILAVWEKRWQGTRLLSDKKRTDPIRIARPNSYDEEMLLIACANR